MSLNVMVLVEEIGELPMMTSFREYLLVCLNNWLLNMTGTISKYVSRVFDIVLIFRETEEPVKDNEKNVDSEKQTGQEGAGDATKENPVDEPEEKEPENKVTLLT